MNDNDKKLDPSEEKRLPTESEQLPIKQKSLDEKIDDVIGPLLVSEGITNSVTIAEDKNGKIAIVYRGHFYDITKLVGGVYKKFRESIETDLG
jgi:hypothetical protein